MSRNQKSGSDSSGEERLPAWERLSDRWQHAVCLGLLTILSLSFFSPIHFGGKQLIGSDTVNWRATAESVLQYEKDTGDPALWATNVFGGMPAYMISYRSIVPQIDTVVSSLRQYLWPSSHFLVLLFGMYVLLFFLTNNKWAGVLSAAAFGLTTYLPVLLSAGHNSKFVALCYAPWLLLGFVYGLRRPGVLASLLFAGLLSVHLRAGHFQITYYLLFVMLIWWLSEGVAAIRSNSTSAFVNSTLTLLAGGVLAAMMVAQPYLSQYEYKAFTIRGSSPGGTSGGLGWDYAMGWSQGVGELITLIVADAYGGSEAYWGEKPFTAGPHYITALVAFLAVIGVLRNRTVATRALGISAVVILLFSLGSNLTLVNRPMFDYFPLFGAFRVPETWLASFALVCAVLAGMGLTSIINEPPDLSLKTSRTVQGYLAFLVILALMVIGDGLFLVFERDSERASVIQQIARSNQVSPDDPRVARAADEFLDQIGDERRTKFSADAWRSILALLVAGGLYALYRRQKLPAALLQAGLFLIVVVDLWGVDRRYFNDSKLTRSSTVENEIPQFDFDRYILEQSADTAEPFRVLSLEGSPTTTARPSFFHESLSGYHGAKLRLYQDFLDQILITPEGGLNMQALRMMNTRYVVARGSIPDTRLAFTDEQTGFGVYEVRGHLPRAFLVDSVVVSESAEGTWALLRNDDLDLRRVAITTEDLELASAAIDLINPNSSSAVLTSHSARRLEVEVATDRERLLVLSEIYYPAGWTASIDGEPTEINRVNYLLRGVVVPPGEHTVVMTFNPSSHRIGLWMAGVSTFLVYGLIVVIVGLRVIPSRSDATEEHAE